MQRTPPSSGRSVVSISLGEYLALQSTLLTWLTVLLELTSFTAWLCLALLTINCGRDYSGGYKCFHFGLSGLTKHGVSRTNDCLVAE